MQIAILSFYNGLVDRGVETWAKSLEVKLRGLHEVKIIGGEKYGKSIDWKSKSYFYWRILFLKHALTTLGEWKDCDVIVATNGGLQSLFCRVMTWIWRKPLIIFGHSGPGADDKWNLLCSPNVFVAFSDGQLKWAEKYKLPWTRLVKISHAVDISFFKPADRKPHKKIVLCVAANQPDKRVDLVRKAVEQLDGFKFYAYGKGNEKEANFDQMPKIYQSADVFCFVPEPWEAFGLVFLEALASNLPVVTIDDPVRLEIVGNAGIFVRDPQDKYLLSSAILEAYETNWGDKPRKQAEKYSWEKIIPKYEKLFNI